MLNARAIALHFTAGNPACAIIYFKIIIVIDKIMFTVISTEMNEVSEAEKSQNANSDNQEISPCGLRP